MAEIAVTSPYLYVATFFFVCSAISSDLLFIRMSLTGGFLFLVLASLSGHSSDGSFTYIPLVSDGIIDITMFINMILFCLNLFICLRLIDDERPRGTTTTTTTTTKTCLLKTTKQLNSEEMALYRFFQSRSNITPLQFEQILKHGEFVTFTSNEDVPKCNSTLYLILEGKVACKAKFEGQEEHYSTPFIKRSGEFFDIKLFNLFSLPVGFDNVDFRAKTLCPTRCFRWNVYGLINMKNSFSPSLREYWEYIVLRSLSSSAIRHHLKKNDTLYDSLMIPEHKSWLDGAPSRDFWKPTTTRTSNWEHLKYQCSIMRQSLWNIIPPRGVRHRPGIPNGHNNPRQAYIELACKTAEAQYEQEDSSGGGGVKKGGFNKFSFLSTMEEGGGSNERHALPPLEETEAMAAAVSCNQEAPPKNLFKKIPSTSNVSRDDDVDPDQSA